MTSGIYLYGVLLLVLTQATHCLLKLHYYTTGKGTRNCELLCFK